MNPLPDRSRIVVLGGAGGMGQVAATEALTFAGVGELIVADLDLPAAERLVAQLAPSAKVPLRATRIDVSDLNALGALLASADVVLNTTGPFYRLGVGVLQTAIAAGCHYIDICDDWEPTLDMLALHDEAVARGVLAVIGLGASPGASNLLARMACDRLDAVDDLYTAWPVDVGVGVEDVPLEEALEATGGMSAAILHWMLQISGQIQVVEDGQLVERTPLAPVTLDYPGLGKGTGYSLGHPEPITLRERVPVRGRSANLMLLKPSTGTFLESLRDDIDNGKLTIEAAAGEVLKPGFARQTKSVLRSLGRSGHGALPPFFAWARGERDGRPKTVGARLSSLPDGMATVTGIPLALGLRQLLEGRIDATGVHPPETVIAPEPFFDGMARVCNPPVTDAAALVVVTESP